MKNLYFKLIFFLFFIFKENLNFFYIIIFLKKVLKLKNEFVNYFVNECYVNLKKLSFLSIQ